MTVVNYHVYLGSDGPETNHSDKFLSQETFVVETESIWYLVMTRKCLHKMKNILL